MRDNYFDCPERERAQWWGDAVNELGQAFYAFDPQAQKLALKAIYELMNWQRVATASSSRRFRRATGHANSRCKCSPR
ncbi:MAG: hypothetical protein ACLR8Y_12300 [Alistipes indistinctus]